MADLVRKLAELAALVHLDQLAKSTLYAVVVYSAFAVVVYVLELRAQITPARYRTRHFLNDIVYTLVYRGGFFDIFVLAAVTNALDARIGFLQLNLLRGVPWPVGLALFWIGGDFLGYWWHRLQHGSRVLWAFHSVHHSQSQMTLLTAWRRHPFELLLANLVVFFGVFHLLLGVPTRGWMPLGAAMTSLQLLQHSQLDWRYGPLHRVVVSPHFHAFHHSTERRHADANFGLMFSCWDFLFGTAVVEPERPARYGVDEVDFQESLASQFVTPFRLAWRWRHRPDAQRDAGSASA